MKKPILIIGVLFLSLATLAQEISHDVSVINIEVPVRVFKGSKFVNNLTINDFEIYEDGKLQKIEAVYLIKKTNIKREETKMKKDISGSIFSAFKDIAHATGGTVDSSANAAFSFKKAVNASENYYLIYYNPKNYKADGKFKKIKVKVKGKNYRVTHRAGYLAD